MVCPAVCCTHGCCMEFVFKINPPHDGIIDQVPVFGSGMHPRCLVLLLKDGACDGKIMFCTETKKSYAIGVDSPNVIRANHPITVLHVLPNLCIKMMNEGKRSFPSS